jgi:hypothetical protein
MARAYSADMRQRVIDRVESGASRHALDLHTLTSLEGNDLRTTLPWPLDSS